MRYAVGDQVEVKYWLSDYFVWRSAAIKGHEGGSYVTCVEDQSIVVADEDIRLPPGATSEATPSRAASVSGIWMMTPQENTASKNN